MAQAAKGFNKGILRRVFRIMAVGKQMSAQVIDPGLKKPNYIGKCGAVPVLDSLDKCRFIQMVSHYLYDISFHDRWSLLLLLLLGSTLIA